MGLIKKKKETAEKLIKDEDKKLWRYWSSWVERAKKAQPKDRWDEARFRYSAKPESEGVDTRPFVNDLRKLHESSMSFLDQQLPTFKISPTDAWVGDEFAEKTAECDHKYLSFVWKEQLCQRAESRKLNEALLINNGNTLPVFDLKKWMPSLRYIKAENVLLSPDCDGVQEDADAQGYEEDVPIEQFRAWHPDLPKAAMDAILKEAGTTLTDEEKEKQAEDDLPMFKTIRVVHIFARNSSAVREPPKDGEDVKLPEKRLAEELELETPRRYLQFAKGWNKALIDEEKWPWDLDHNEFPITNLQFNQDGSLYGFTDYQQMKRLDEQSDDQMRDIGIASFWAAVQHYIGSKSNQHNPAQIEHFLNSARTAFLDDMMDAEGKPKLAPVERGQLNPALMEAYNLVHDQSKEASGQSELLENADVQGYKDVTAIGARIADANMHQRVNRRLGGPWGYEQSIAEDAIKMLEIAHQYVPQVSVVAVVEPVEVIGGDDLPVIDPVTGQALTEEKEVLKDLPWPEALAAIAEGGQLIKLGVDSIVGSELAQFWAHRVPPEQWKLSTKVIVEPGTTRTITKDQQVAVMKQIYIELFAPFYTQLSRFDLMRGFLEYIGRLAGVPNVEDKLPTVDEINQWIEQQMMMQQQMAAGGGEAGGQPLNSPEATGGEEQY